MQLFFLRPLPLSVVFLNNFIVSVSAQYLPTTTVTGSTTLWSATPGAPSTTVRALPVIPTLIYNCHNVPALCNNVEKAGRVGAAAGNYPGGFEAFGWDPDPGRKSRRRTKRCGRGWKTSTDLDPNRRGCPHPNQPPIHPLRAINPPGGISLDPSTYALLTTDPSSGSLIKSGIMLTCDEFPPAM